MAAAGVFAPLVARGQGGPIRIGFIAPLSGAQAIVGNPMRIGAEVARDQVNRSGGIDGRMIELVVRDDKGNPTESVAAARELTSSGVNLIVGVPLTATAMAVTGVMPSLNGVYMATGTGEEKLTHELFNRHFFTTLENNYTRNRAFAHFMAQRFPDITSWIAVYPDVTVGHDSWKRTAGGLTEYYKSVAKKDVTLADPILTKFGATDFKTQIAALMASPATGLYSVLFGSDGITFFQQARQFGIDRKFKVIGEQALDNDLPKALKRNMLANVWTISFWYHGAHKDNPESQDLVRASQAQTGDPNPHGFTAPAHIGVKAYAAAIKAAKSTDTAAVIAALEGMKLDTVKGPGVFRKEDHQMVSHMNLVNFAAAEGEPGWGVKEFVTLDTAPIVNPPTPGVALKV
jgi:branched-chain amino acid transport system substrate-binding protein